MRRSIELDTEFLDTAQVAALVGKQPKTVRRWFDSGKLPGTKVARDGRAQWVGTRDDVERFLAARTGTTLQALADELDLTYHEVWQAAHREGVLGPNRSRGGRISLESDAADVLRLAVVCDAATAERRVG